MQIDAAGKIYVAGCLTPQTPESSKHRRGHQFDRFSVDCRRLADPLIPLAPRRGSSKGPSDGRGGVFQLNQRIHASYGASVHDRLGRPGISCLQRPGGGL